ncbi:MAG TPA: acyltransferase, partial [Flavisolibacter sp.]|nr:acyltransferase [Flavisolibacter sp.]
MKYIKQLDSLRAIAVILVIITHWFPEGHPLNFYTGVFNGVDIFFVLSGFLITRILLENRKEAEALGTSKLQITRNFYIRRFLRIFPIYYAYILVLFILGPKTGTHIRENIPYFLTYTANFYFLQHKWEGMLSHLWSLSVEEQFYLLWPWLMLFLRRTFVLPVILAAIGIGTACQYFYSDIATVCCFDGFGLGALLAWACVYNPDGLQRFYVPSCILAAV